MNEMLKYLEDFPVQCEQAVQIAKKFPVDVKRYDSVQQVVVCGMGGSAAGGDLLKSYLRREARIPIEVNRDYILPQYAGKKTLVFAISYSGNTEETLSAYQDALSRSAKIIAVTSGGKLKELCQKDGIDVIEIIKGMPPRATFGYLFFPMVTLLERLGLIGSKEKEIKETIQNLRILCKQYNQKSKANLAKDISERIKGHLLLIYASQHLAACAVRWKNQFNENSKGIAFFSLLPEMNHNEIEVWASSSEFTKKFYLIFLRDNAENERIKHRILITEDILKDKVAGIQHVISSGECLLSRLHSLIYLGDWVSTYLALTNSIDPIPTPMINLLKKQLSQV
ncbi:MAG: bifunctional phosphoglucose/phosphomannose isomerase, partial [Elusimicrobiota bacterium]|nr:bifunctional phosphoglucose/phosphomannose isomerase [Elusimicrobiota bacterium]